MLFRSYRGFHHLPRLFIYLGEHDSKVCAILDTGSECNLIPWTMVESRGIAWSPTTTVSVGLHGKESFMGECVVPVWLGPHVVSQHFFILDDSKRNYSVILGMPFVQNTKMTFDYLESGGIRAKLVMDDNKLLIASCFVPELSRRKKTANPQ